MQGETTITFTQPGVEPPVYMVTSLSTPPWAPLEMKPSKEKTPSGDFVFEQTFGNVAEGSYQYKIRVGEGHWVIDESKETATDEHGNRNNVIHVKPAASHSPLNRTANVKSTIDRKDSTMDTTDLNPGPIPFVVVEKVEDKDRPEYGDVQPKRLSVDESKRGADPEPDFEDTKLDAPLDTDLPGSPEVPLIMVEKVDDKPAHGDDFGKDATNGQKLAHELRSADASPDRLVVSPEESDELEPPEAQAPLFKHESFQASEDSLPEPTMDTIEEESAQSSTDHTSSGDVINTPSAESQEDLQDDDVLDHGPLLPHETGFTPQAKHTDSDYEENEFDAAPLLPHETGFSSYRNGEATSEGRDLTKDEYDYEPDHYTRYWNHSDNQGDHGELDHAPTFSHEQDLLAEDYGAPLLAHERGSVAESFSGSERSFSISPTTYEGAYPPFRQETDSAKELFGGSMRSPFFRTRTSSSTLPNKLPRSDAEDTNLHDPGLEMFPVGREQILERVATIGHKLPEDETHDAPSSPQPSILSQACSSVDLAPVKSYISLASVQEDLEEEDEEDGDVESLGSPMLMSHPSNRFARDRDPLATPHPDDSKQLGFVPDDKPETQSTHTAESSEANSVSKTDGTEDSSKGLTSLSDIVASRATVMNTLTPPLTPRAPDALGDENSTSVPESELRQRRELAKATPESASTPRPEGSKDEDIPVAAPPMVSSVAEKLEPAAEKVKPKSGSLHTWKGAGIGVSALFAAWAVYYYFAALR